MIYLATVIALVLLCLLMYGIFKDSAKREDWWEEQERDFFMRKHLEEFNKEASNDK